MVELAEIQKEETVLEIGPGLGHLTELLAQRAKEVLAVEKDFAYVQYLRGRLAKNNQIKIIHQDILAFDQGLLENYKIVANLPYQITSPVLKKFLTSPNQPKLLLLMIQKEVAQRITAHPGNSERSILTIMVEFFSQAEILMNLAATMFYPAPKVSSSLVKIKPIIPLLKEEEQPQFFRIVKAGFAQKRRQIHNSLSGTLRIPDVKILTILKRIKIDPLRRAEDLTINEWIKLAQELKGFYS
jgi:16S rRNA (adenine1518-N6/adenine1519-N6)-dimethyltransferase